MAKKDNKEAEYRAYAERLHAIVFPGTPFDEVAWNATARGPFATRKKINALAERVGDTPLTQEEYDVAKTAYYERYPSAKRG